jgi:hypothetical protein
VKQAKYSPSVCVSVENISAAEDFYLVLYTNNTGKGIRGLTREFLTLLMPLFFFSVERLLCYIILVLGLSLGELPSLLVLDFLRQTSISGILSLL